MMTTQYGLSGFVSERGLINKGYHSSNTVLSFPMRKATSDTFLPRDPTLMQNARRTYTRIRLTALYITFCVERIILHDVKGDFKKLA